MKSATDTDNRTPADVIAFLEARVEALTRRVQELERESEALRHAQPNRHSDMHLGAEDAGGD